MVARARRGTGPGLPARSAAASTLVTGLELACQGWTTLAQEELFGDVRVHAGGRPMGEWTSNPSLQE